MNKHDNTDANIDLDVLEEIREILIHASESRSWPSVEEALELLNDSLGYEESNSSDDLEE